MLQLLMSDETCLSGIEVLTGLPYPSVATTVGAATPLPTLGPVETARSSESPMYSSPLIVAL